MAPRPNPSASSGAPAGMPEMTPPSNAAARPASTEDQADWSQPAGGGKGLRDRLGLAKKQEAPAAAPAAHRRADDDRGPDTAVIPAVPANTAKAAAPAGRTESQRVPDQQHTPGQQPKHGAARRTRKARLRLSRLDPWSVMKTSFLFSIAAGIMLVVAVYVVWTVIGASSLFESVNDIVKSVVSTPGDTTPFQIQEYINTQKVMGVAALLACVDVVIFTALATLGSFLYNLAATMLGGLEITLAED